MCTMCVCVCMLEYKAHGIAISFLSRKWIHNEYISVVWLQIQSADEFPVDAIRNLERTPSAICDNSLSLRLNLAVALYYSSYVCKCVCVRNMNCFRNKCFVIFWKWHIAFATAATYTCTLRKVWQKSAVLLRRRGRARSRVCVMASFTAYFGAFCF